jgi:putative effector of murein hydrolase
MTLDLALEMDSDVVTCPIALNIASQLRWAPALPHVLRLRTSPPD